MKLLLAISLFFSSTVLNAAPTFQVADKSRTIEIIGVVDGGIIEQAEIGRAHV